MNPHTNATGKYSYQCFPIFLYQIIIKNNLPSWQYLCQTVFLTTNKMWYKDCFLYTLCNNIGLLCLSNSNLCQYRYMLSGMWYSLSTNDPSKYVDQFFLAIKWSCPKWEIAHRDKIHLFHVLKRHWFIVVCCSQVWSFIGKQVTEVLQQTIIWCSCPVFVWPINICTMAWR